MDSFSPRPPSFGARLLGVLGLVVHAAVGLLVYIPFGLIAPTTAHLAMGGVWLLFALVGIAWFRGRPERVPAIPVLAVLAALIVAYLGERFWGWTA